MSELPNPSNNNEEILDDIQKLQEMEQTLFNNLETNTNLSRQQKEEIVDKINQLSTMRINLYNTLSGINNFSQNALATSIGSLMEQTSAIGVIENELNRSKARLELLEVEKNNKIRLVQINEYYGEKYNEHANLMKIIIFTLIPIIIITILFNKNILPSNIYYILLIIIGFIGGFCFWWRYASIILRDNMNYNEYDWGFNPASAPTSTTSGSDSDPWVSNIKLGTCVGEFCCADDQMYDTNLNKCVYKNTNTTDTNTTDTNTTDTNTTDTNTTDTNTESFLTGVYTKLQPGKYKIDYDMKPQLKSYNS